MSVSIRTFDPDAGAAVAGAAKLQGGAARLKGIAEAAAERCPDVRHIIPGGIAAPAHVREAALSAALRDFDELRRLDMGVLAQTLGVSRSTLYRQAGDRESLLGHALWWRGRMIYARVLESTQGRQGLDRIVAVVGHVLGTYVRSPALRRFVDEEPQAAMRVLTAPDGYVQPGFVAVTQRLLENEIDRGDLAPMMDVATLAYAVVRLGEGFMYTDVLGTRESGHRPSVRSGIEVVESLLQGALPRR